MNRLHESLLIALLFTGLFSCQRLEDGPGRRAGSAITFGASTGYANAPATRTEYSGLDGNGNSIVSTSNYERIDWVAGSDRIRILCAAAGNGPTADYAIAGTPTASGAKSSAGITPVAENGLQWGSGDHYFYAMYPAPGMRSNYGFTDNNPVSESNALIESSGVKAVLTGVIPDEQEAYLVGREFKANMNYAYMYAATKVSGGAAGEVSLSFHPLVTTFEFTFLTPSDAAITGKLTSVSLSSSSTPLSGTFVATLGEGGVEGITTQNTGGVVTVTLPGGGVELSSAYEYKVTLLTLPVKQTNLTLTLNFEGGVKRTLELKDNDMFITVPARNKVYIRNLNVPGRFETESMDLIVSSNATVGRTFRLPFSVGTLPTKITVDWGDGSEPETFAAGTAITAGSLTHTYADSADGDHTVTVTSEFPASYSGALIPDFNFSTVNSSSKPMLKGLPTPILECGSANFIQAFEGCANLESICQDLFINNTEVTSFKNTFKECTSLTSIPGGMFDNNPKVTNFNSTFYNCTGVTSIPEGLFDNNPKVTDFSRTFYNCTGVTSIPEGLFDNNPKANLFVQTFYGCTGVTSIPARLFDNNAEATSFQYTFRASGVTSIPPGLFDNNTKVTGFVGTFQACGNLIGPIPAGLFDNNAIVKSFSSTFQKCRNLIGPIPAGLFDNNSAVTSFSTTFSGCINLTGSIPEGLFDNNPEVTSFNGTFSYCESLTGSIPDGLFDNNTKVTDFNQTFYSCLKLDGPIPVGLFDKNPEVKTFNGTFHTCSSLSGPIPAGLFDNNTKVTSFSGTFSKCTGIDGPIPAGLFDNNPSVTNFASLFAGCSSLTGQIPAGLFDKNPEVKTFNGTFSTCFSLSGPIPADLFYNNTEVTDFSLVLSECFGLDGPIPGGFFANNKKANNFSSAFRNCKKLQVVSDVFVKEGTSSPANRFSGVSSVNFGDCFRNTGIFLGSRGTAPDLWTYSLPSSVTKSGCFRVDNEYLNPPAFTNQGDIPGAWL